MGLGCSFRPRIRRKRESEDVLCARTRRSRRRLWHTRYGAGQDMMLPNPGATSKEDLARFKFLGKLIGVAARQGICLPLRWPSIVWKQLVHQPGVSADLAAYDQSFMDHVLAALQVRTSACQLCSCGSQCQLLTLRFNGCRRVLCSPADVARRRLTVAALPASTTVLCSQMGAQRSIWFLMGAPSLCLQIEVGLGCHCGVVLCTYHSVPTLVLVVDSGNMGKAGCRGPSDRMLSSSRGHPLWSASRAAGRTPSAVQLVRPRCVVWVQHVPQS